MNENSIQEVMKTLVEKIQPDLRDSMRFELTGEVTKSNENDYTVNVKIGDNEYENIKVRALWAQDGYGIWSLPCVGSTVSIGYFNASPDDPFVSGSLYYGDNKAPSGMKAGMLAFVGKEGQKIVFSDSESLIEVFSDTYKIEAKNITLKSTEDRTDETGGNYEHTITGTSKVESTGNMENTSTGINTLEGSQIKIGKGVDGVPEQAIILGTNFLNTLLPILVASVDTYGKPTMPGAATLLAETFLSKKGFIE